MSELLKNTRIVLCETRHAGNIGASARAMKTMGLEVLCLVNPQDFPSPEATRRASRAVELLNSAKVCGSLEEALQGVGLAVACTARPRQWAAPVLSAREACLRIAPVALNQPVALVFGNETSGLTTAQVSQCQLIVNIPSDPDYSSLNLAAAVQVLAYEMRLQALERALESSQRPPLSSSFADHATVEGFYVHLEQALVQCGYLNPQHPKKLMQRIRRLFSRSGLEPEEVNLLRGVVRTLQQPKRRWANHDDS
jgi:tRNA/rRNA methyltransferase